MPHVSLSRIRSVALAALMASMLPLSPSTALAQHDEHSDTEAAAEAPQVPLLEAVLGAVHAPYRHGGADRAGVLRSGHADGVCLHAPGRDPLVRGGAEAGPALRHVLLGRGPGAGSVPSTDG
jgi:hypothetical protein